MVITRTPLRISFLGGGTDFREYFTQHGPGAVVSMAIDKYVYVTVKPMSPLFPYKYKIATSDTQTCNHIDEIRNPIVRETLRMSPIASGLDIGVMSDVPAGTGLGSSSSFTVGLLNALDGLRGVADTSISLAKRAIQIELDVLKEPIGVQDQYIASLGGLKRLIFEKEGGVSTQVLDHDQSLPQRLLERLMLFYLGGSRQANSILGEQQDNMKANLPHLDAMRDQALGIFEPTVLGERLKVAWEHKKKLASAISNSHVESLIESCLRLGAEGCKLLGAGGTGFLLVLAEKQAQSQIKNFMKDSQHSYVGVRMDTKGSCQMRGF